MQSPDNQAPAAADGQWERMRASFDGDWQGITTWYGRDGEGMNLTQGTASAEVSRYSIRFSDAHTGEWHGTGLRFAPGGERRFPLYRRTYNLGHNCWHFPHTAGQSSLQMDGGIARAGHEVNFFNGRSRSMLVVLYQQQPDGQMLLDSIAATPFRCQRTAPEAERDQFQSLEELFAAVSGWRGGEAKLLPGCSAELTTSPKPTAPFRADTFAVHNVNGLFADNLICSLPDRLPEDAFQLHIGCCLDAASFVHVVIGFDERHDLTGWVERRFQSTRHG